VRSREAGLEELGLGFGGEDGFLALGVQGAVPAPEFPDIGDDAAHASVLEAVFAVGMVEGGAGLAVAERPMATLAPWGGLSPVKRVSVMPAGVKMDSVQ